MAFDARAFEVFRARHDSMTAVVVCEMPPDPLAPVTVARSLIDKGFRKGDRLFLMPTHPEQRRKFVELTTAEYNIIGILPTLYAFTEESVALVRDEFLRAGVHLAGVSFAASFVVSNKQVLVDTQAAAGLSAPETYRCYEYAEAIEAITNIHGKYIVKFSDMAGSLDVQAGDSSHDIPLEMRERLRTMVSAADARLSPVLVQRFVPGREFGITAVVRDGRVACCYLTEKAMTRLPNREELEHAIDPQLESRFPGLSDAVIGDVQALIDQINKDCSSSDGLAVGTTLFNGDMILTEGGDRVILDCGFRAGGMLPILISAATNEDFQEKVIQEVVFGEPQSYPRPRRAAVQRVAFPDGGLALNAADDHLNEMLLQSGTPFTFVEAPVIPGQRLATVRDYRGKEGHPNVLLTGTTLEDARRKCDKALADSGIVLTRRGQFYSYTEAGLQVREMSRPGQPWSPHGALMRTAATTLGAPAVRAGKRPPQSGRTSRTSVSEASKPRSSPHRDRSR